MWRRWAFARRIGYRVDDDFSTAPLTVVPSRASPSRERLRGRVYKVVNASEQIRTSDRRDMARAPLADITLEVRPRTYATSQAWSLGWCNRTRPGVVDRASDGPESRLREMHFAPFRMTARLEHRIGYAYRSDQPCQCSSVAPSLKSKVSRYALTVNAERQSVSSSDSSLA